MLTPFRIGHLCLALAAVGCVRDGWVPASSQDAGADVAAADVAAADAPDAVADRTDVPGGDAGNVCGPRSGQPRCGATCADGPTNLYRAEGDTTDGVGSQHATQGNAGFAAGRFGQAFAFDQRAMQYVTLPAGLFEFGEGDFTVSLWFSSTLHGNVLSKRAVCWGAALPSGLDLRLHANGLLHLEIWTSTAYYSHVSPTGFNDGRWHHVAIVREGGTLSFNIDGAVVASGEFIGAMHDPANTPVYLGVGPCVPGAPGGGMDGLTTWLDGRLDEVAFLRRALSQAEILAVAQGRCAL